MPEYKLTNIDDIGNIVSVSMADDGETIAAATRDEDNNFLIFLYRITDGILVEDCTMYPSPDGKIEWLLVNLSGNGSRMTVTYRLENKKNSATSLLYKVEKGHDPVLIEKREHHCILSSAHPTFDGSQVFYLNQVRSSEMQVVAADYGSLEISDLKPVTEMKLNTSGLHTALEVSGDGNTFIIGRPSMHRSAGQLQFFRKIGGVWVKEMEEDRLDVSAMYGTNIQLSFDGNEALVKSSGKVTYFERREEGGWIGRAVTFDNAPRGMKVVWPVSMSESGQGLALHMRHGKDYYTVFFDTETMEVTDTIKNNLPFVMDISRDGKVIVGYVPGRTFQEFQVGVLKD